MYRFNLRAWNPNNARQYVGHGRVASNSGNDVSYWLGVVGQLYEEAVRAGGVCIWPCGLFYFLSFFAAHGRVSAVEMGWLPLVFALLGAAGVAVVARGWHFVFWTGEVEVSLVVDWRLSSLVMFW